MTQILTANTGGFPRIGENKDEQRHRRGMGHWLKKEISNHAFRDVEQSVIQEVIREQIDTGVDEITDGLINWLDPVSFFCQNLTNVKITGLTRYLDRNFYYRLPVLTARPKQAKPLLLPFYQFATAHSTVPVRAILTGPVALGRLTASTAASFKTVSARAEAFTELLTGEIDQLVKNGAKHIQIDEPTIALFPEDFPLLKKSLDILVKYKPPARLILSVGSGSLVSLYEKLASLPVDVLNMDFTYDGKKLFDKITSVTARPALGFGVVNAATPQPCDIASISQMVRAWIEKNKPSIVYLTPSSTLEQLPRAAAIEKLKSLVAIKKELGS